MLRQVEVGTAMNTFYFLETEWHLEFNIGCGIGIVSQFLMVMETIVLCTKS